MKWFIASDIHGSAYYCAEMLSAFDREKADKLLLLGDILYHGPRNELPRDYSPKKVIEMLNARRDYILCVRGNCDAEIDQTVLSFPILADYAVIDLGEREIFVTHGHLFNKDKLPPLKKGGILLNGHFHVPECVEHENYIYMNPGSVSLPKENSWHGYMTLEDGEFLFKELGGEVKISYRIR